MNSQLQMLAWASGNMATLVRSALPRTSPDGSITFHSNEVMELLSAAGTVSSCVAMLQQSNVLDNDAQQEHARSVVSENTRRDVQLALAAEAGVNVPEAGKMARAVAAADELNRLNPPVAAPQRSPAPLSLKERMAQQDQPQQTFEEKELITGNTGAPQQVTRQVSPENKKRNEEIQRRLRQHNSSNNAIPPAPTAEPVQPLVQQQQTPKAPSVTPAASAARKVMQEQAPVNVTQPEIFRTETPANVVSRKPLGPVAAKARADGYVPAVGANRDVTTANQNVLPMHCEIPEEEQIAGRNATEPYLPIEGLNVNAPAPYQRLTDPEFSEFAMIFAASPFAPDSKGVVSIPHPDFPWNRDVELPSLQGLDLVRRPQGFYGFNPHNGGPNYVLIRLNKNIVIWNFNHTPGNCRIFYIGRSNVTGHWYTPEALDKTELFTLVAELAQLRASLVAKAEGREYVPVARSML